MSLIVLFAIIAIMLYRSLAEPYEIKGLADTEKTAVVREFANRVIAVVPQKKCDSATASVSGASGAASSASATGTTASAAAAQECPPGETRYSVFVRSPPGQESSDLAKQLLILIGTLMTSVTSFYFASRVGATSGAGVPGDDSTIAAPTVTEVNPSAIEFIVGEAFTVKFAGTNLDSLQSIQLQRDKSILTPAQLTLKRTIAIATFVPTEVTPDGLWTVALIDDSSRVGLQTDQITLSKKVA